jgi:hypothetical protein
VCLRFATTAQQSGFDIDAVTETDLEELPAPIPALTMSDLDVVISTQSLMPPGSEVKPMGSREYALRQPGLQKPIRVSTDPAYYEEHADNVELWSPGSPIFPKTPVDSEEPAPNSLTLADLLKQSLKSETKASTQ